MAIKQKAEMTMEGFIEKHKKYHWTIEADGDGKRYMQKHDNVVEVFADLRSVIRGELILFMEWNMIEDFCNPAEVVDKFLNNNQ